MTTANTPSSLLLAEPLEKLPVHLNAVLIQIGKLFKHQAIPEQRVLGVQKTQLHDAISKTTRKFHDALDEIEVEILNARAVLGRDLNAIKARQVEREHAELAATRNQVPEEPNTIEEAAMHDSIEDSTAKIHSPQLDQLAEIPDHGQLGESDEVSHEAQMTEVADQPTEELKNIDLDDDLFGDPGDFGPVDENSNFDLFNSTTGGDFDMDFSVEPEISSATAPQAAPAPDSTTGNATTEVILDNDLLMEPFADISATGNTEANEFGDLDFGAIDHTQGDVNVGDNPFGEHTDIEFDDYFNS